MVTCHQTDYVEIACMYRYPIKLVLKSGHEVLGAALDTKWNENKQECIEVKTEDATTKLVVLEDISILEVLIDNPHFTNLTFN